MRVLVVAGIIVLLILLGRLLVLRVGARVARRRDDRRRAESRWELASRPRPDELTEFVARRYGEPDRVVGSVRLDAGEQEWFDARARANDRVARLNELAALERDAPGRR